MRFKNIFILIGVISTLSSLGARTDVIRLTSDSESLEKAWATLSSEHQSALAGLSGIYKGEPLVEAMRRPDKRMGVRLLIIPMAELIEDINRHIKSLDSDSIDRRQILIKSIGAGFFFAGTGTGRSLPVIDLRMKTDSLEVSSPGMNGNEIRTKFFEGVSTSPKTKEACIEAVYRGLLIRLLQATDRISTDEAQNLAFNPDSKSG